VEPQHQSAILWEERDLTNSSAERITLVEATVLADHILTKMIKVVSNAILNAENIRRNLEMQRGLNLSEAVMIEMTRRGVGRQEAHEILRQASMMAYQHNSSLLEELLKDQRVMKYFREDELREMLKPENYLGTAKERIERVVKWVNEVLK